MNNQSESNATVDPVTLEVLRGHLGAVADEMEHTFLKNSYSTITTEAQDATAAVYFAIRALTGGQRRITVDAIARSRPSCRKARLSIPCIPHQSMPAASR